MAYGSATFANLMKKCTKIIHRVGGKTATKGSSNTARAAAIKKPEQWIGGFSNNFNAKKTLTPKREALIGRLSNKTSNGYTFKTAKSPKPNEFWQSAKDMMTWKNAALAGGTGLAGYGLYEAGKAMFGGGGGANDGEEIYVDETPYQMSTVDGYYQDPYAAPMNQQYVQPKYSMTSQYEPNYGLPEYGYMV